jgi:acetoin utilization deacetylase AcuC-like enzyme
MKAFFTDHFVLPLPPGHRFPMAKYALLRERVAASALGVELAMPPAAGDDELRAAHSETYLAKVRHGALDRAEVKRLGFPWSPALVERSRRSCGATLAACREALRSGRAVNLAGGTHHAFRDHGEGFCVFNDSMVAARTLVRDRRVRRVVVVDCDVHQGNGTAAIAAGDPSVFTFSIHCEANFPFEKEKSDLDIAVPAGTGDGAYLEQLEGALAWIGARFAPDLAIYLAGADPLAGDRLGRLALTKKGLAERDRLVLGWCARHDFPVAIAMAGGYAPDVHDTVDVHFETVRAAAESARAFGA